MKNARIKVMCAFLGSMIALASSAAVTEKEAARLGADLTPYGAEKAGNKDGSIPAWTGTEAPLSGWSYGKLRGEFWKHYNDKPLYVIDASNVDKYADKLSSGQVQLVKQNKGYKMPVYPSQRTCGNPDFVTANTKKNATGAKVNPDGWTISDAVLPGVPFPIPTSGIEVLWNSKFKYEGVGLDMPNFYTSVSPRPGSTDWIDAAQFESYFYPSGKKGSTPLAQLPEYEFKTYFAYTSPTALAGQALSVTINLKKGNDVYYYFPGQRRVRRMPTYAYDSPQIGLENQYTMDEPRMFNGNPDRFDFKLIGKKEMIVPYNMFGMYDFKADYHSVAKNEFIADNHRRYEMHRVWVVEATLKQGLRHVAPKKVFYIDEDTWAVLVGDDYDAQNKLWKVRESAVIPVYETGGCDSVGVVQYNLIDNRYVVDGLSFGGGKDFQWFVEATGQKQKESFYTSDNLRSISER